MRVVFIKRETRQSIADGRSEQENCARRWIEDPTHICGVMTYERFACTYLSHEYIQLVQIIIHTAKSFFEAIWLNE